MNRLILTSLLIFVCLLFIVNECYAWTPPVIRIWDWNKKFCLGENAGIYAQVISYGPIYDWDWNFTGALEGDFTGGYWGSSATVWSDTPGTYFAEAWGRNLYEWGYDYAIVRVVAVDSVTSDKETAACCEDITFTVITIPSGQGSLISWSGGGSPPTGMGSTFTTHWPCIGGKTVTATCCDSNESKNVTITLPSECEAGSAEAIFEANKIGLSPSHCGYGDCGKNILPLGNEANPTIEIEVVYNDCEWVFQIYAVQDVEVGICPDVIDLTDYFSELTEDNYCAIVSAFILGMCYSNGTDMVTDLECAMIHENAHFAFYQYVLTIYEEYFYGIHTTPINCNDPTTTTCQAVESYWSSSLRTAIKNNFWYAWQDCEGSEEEAKEAAEECYNSVAQMICYYSITQSWRHCFPCEKFE